MNKKKPNIIEIRKEQMAVTNDEKYKLIRQIH